MSSDLGFGPYRNVEAVTDAISIIKADIDKYKSNPNDVRSKTIRAKIDHVVALWRALPASDKASLQQNLSNVVDDAQSAQMTRKRSWNVFKKLFCCCGSKIAPNIQVELSTNLSSSEMDPALVRIREIGKDLYDLMDKIDERVQKCEGTDLALATSEKRLAAEKLRNQFDELEQEILDCVAKKNDPASLLLKITPIQTAIESLKNTFSIEGLKTEYYSDPGAV
ncbi:MAG: hypothetical protein K2Y01_11020 [Rhabdochlamydiaceae bacterium]|nr:hypothetical protein [Rhabdochlamydiaceae bacterium]